MGAKRSLNGTSKVKTHTEKHTDKHTNKHTYGYFDLYKASAQRADASKIYSLNTIDRNMIKKLLLISFYHMAMV